MEAMNRRFDDILCIQDHKEQKKAVSDFALKSNWLQKQLETAMKMEFQKTKKKFGLKNEDDINLKLNSQIALIKKSSEEKLLNLGGATPENRKRIQQDIKHIQLKGAFAIRN